MPHNAGCPEGRCAGARTRLPLRTETGGWGRNQPVKKIRQRICGCNEKGCGAAGELRGSGGFLGGLKSLCENLANAISGANSPVIGFNVGAEAPTPWKRKTLAPEGGRYKEEPI
jgi:hypothetical protein